MLTAKNYVVRPKIKKRIAARIISNQDYPTYQQDAHQFPSFEHAQRQVCIIRDFIDLFIMHWVLQIIFLTTNLFQS